MLFSATQVRFLYCMVLVLAQTTLSFSQSSNIPLHTYPMSKDIETGLTEGKMKINKAAQYLSYIGEYQAVASIPYEIKLEWGFDTLREVDREYFSLFTPKPAAQAIIERAVQEQIVIVNEAHHKPAHRVLTSSLLSGLYEKGFRYFGLEALSNCAYVPAEYCDEKLNERGYAYNSPITGTYITEPQMGNLIREAIEIGFTLFAYEQFGETREQNQAHYITEVLRKDPAAKILIQCGWYHLLEATNKDKTWMAAYLRDSTGIDPFTIYQDILVERPSTKESPFYSMMNFDQPMVFVNDKGHFYNGFEDIDLFDALIYHPRSTYERNRPNWLIEYADNEMYNVPKEFITVGYPCLIKAFKADEPDSAVPVDIIQREYADDSTVLVLSPGRYRLVITNTSGESQEWAVTMVSDE